MIENHKVSGSNFPVHIKKKLGDSIKKKSSSKKEEQN